MQKRWVVKPQSDVQSLVDALGVNKITAQLLVNRGIYTPDAAAKFLSPSLEDILSPFLLAGMAKSAKRVADAIQKRETIAVYGDYDVDGITGTSLLTLLLKELGGNVLTYIPHRIKEGYGLNIPAIKNISQQGATLLITVDTGTTAIEAAEFCKSISLDLIITDHHRPHGKLPDAFALLNPYHPNSEYPDLGLCGVGVAFNLAAAVRQELKKRNYFDSHPMPNLRRYLDLVALGTVADMVPLTGVNRTLVMHGLPLLTEAHRPGIRALLQVSGLQGEVTPSHIGFVLGPRINAGGRLEDGNIALSLLTTENFDEAKELAQLLDQMNRDRRAMQDEIFEHALEQLRKDPGNEKMMVTVVAGEGWHPGVVGIVASKLLEHFYRPTVVLTLQPDGSAKGSARSIPGVDLPLMLEQCEEFLKEWGGHAMAAGLTLKPNVLDLFKNQLSEIVQRSIDEEVFIPFLNADLYLEPEELSENLMKELDLLRPFGLGNPEPLFLTKNLRLISKRIVGEKHLKLEVQSGRQRHDAIAFHQAEWIERLSREVAIAYTPEINIWNGRRTIQLRVRDLQKPA